MTDLNLTPAPRVRRPRPKVVSLTDAAADRVREIMARAEVPYAGLRVGVKNAPDAVPQVTEISVRDALWDSDERRFGGFLAGAYLFDATAFSVSLPGELEGSCEEGG